MRSVWVLRDEDGERIGAFETREQAEAVLHPSVVGRGVYSLEEVELGPVGAGVGDVYGPVFSAYLDLDTGEDLRGPTTAYRFRSDREPDSGEVMVHRDCARARGQSVTSAEAALAVARRLREEHLAAGKPTRLPVERVQLEGDTTATLGWKAEFPSPVEVTPGAVSVQSQAVSKQGLVAAIEFRRTGRRTPEGLAVFALATS